MGGYKCFLQQKKNLNDILGYPPPHLEKKNTDTQHTHAHTSNPQGEIKANRHAQTHRKNNSFENKSRDIFLQLLL